MGFEGGQMPLQRRLPKFGFTSRKSSRTSEISLSDLASVQEAKINLDALKKEGIVRKSALRARVIATGKVDKSIIINGIYCTKGARTSIEKVGGKVE